MHSDARVARSSALGPLIVDYYAVRAPLVGRALFVGVQGKRLNDTQLDQLVRHYVEASGVGERKRVTPHTLRHVFASELLHAATCARSRSSSATSTSTRPSATRA
jgi:site-specific recombinase XerD